MKCRFLLFSLLFMFSCSSDGELGPTPDKTGKNEENTGLIQEEKAVIALMPVRFSEQDPIAETLGEAYSITLSDLLESMQTYDLRGIPAEYSMEKVLNRGFDNLIQAEAGMAEDGALHLSAEVLDGRSGEVMVNLERQTRDYLNVFPIAEEMVQTMVEEFYGSHIALSSFRVDSNQQPFTLFVDGVYRETDVNNRISLLAGRHEFLILGDEEDQYYTRKILDCKEGEVQSLKIAAHTLNQSLYMGNKRDIKIDGNPEDWEDISYTLEEFEDLIPVEPSLDFTGLKLTADRDKIYGLIRLAGPAKSGKVQYMIALHTLGNNSSQILIEPNSPSSQRVQSYDRVMVHSSSGWSAASGEFIEFSCSIDTLDLYFDTANMLRVEIFDGGRSDNSDDIASKLGKISVTRNPSNFLLWKNRSYQAGTDSLQSTYLVPDNLIDIDRKFEDWGYIPIVCEDEQTTGEGQLIQLKSALTSDRFLVYLKSNGRWDEDKRLTLELDLGYDEPVELILDKKQVLYRSGGSDIELEASVEWKGDQVEFSLPLDFTGSNPDYVNIMRVEQIEGNRLHVIPYY